MTKVVLKPWQNKKGQMFVEMHCFWIFFLQQAADWLKFKEKRIKKWCISPNIWPFLFWQSFSLVLMPNLKIKSWTDSNLCEHGVVLRLLLVVFKLVEDFSCSNCFFRVCKFKRNWPTLAEDFSFCFSKSRNSFLLFMSFV